MRRVIISVAARQEAADQHRYYEKAGPGKGSRFTASLNDAIRRAATHALAGMHGWRDTRSILLENFPFKVIYEVFRDERIVVVAAVLHGARHDREWKRTYLGEMHSFNLS